MLRVAIGRLERPTFLHGQTVGVRLISCPDRLCHGDGTNDGGDHECFALRPNQSHRECLPRRTASTQLCGRSHTRKHSRNMVVSGAVALSVTPEFKTGLAPQGVPNAPEVVIYLLGKSTDGEFRNAPTMKIDDLKHAIQLVLQNEGAAELITASPTSRGFRHSF
jgi:hypothetical protein